MAPNSLRISTTDNYTWHSMGCLFAILISIILISMIMASEGYSFWGAVLYIIGIMVGYVFFSNLGDIYRYFRDKIRNYRIERKKCKQEEVRLEQQDEQRKRAEERLLQVAESIRINSNICPIKPEQLQQQKEDNQHRLQEREKHFFVCHLAGRSYHDADKVKDLLKVGTPLLLKREPDNPHDKNAVAVMFHNIFNGKDYCLGYIPREFNKPLAQILDAGHSDLFQCTILEADPYAHPEEQIHLAIDILPTRESQTI
jgi:hypothetical protein